MSEKRYYWLKLKEDYFISPKIKKLRKIAGGDTYTIIYLKMQLLSIRNQGIIQFEGIEASFEEELALKLDEDIDNVMITLEYLKSQCLIEENNNEYLFIDASENIGTESSSAERVRRFRENKQKMEVEMNNIAKSLQCNTDVTDVKRNYISISNSKSNSNNIYIEVLDYLNNKAETKYRNVESNFKHIKARMNDGFTIDDFKIVIDKKCQEWKGTEFEKYLTPETLFRPSNFEKYLNQKIIKAKKESDFNQRTYTSQDLNNMFDDIDTMEI